MNGLRNRMRRSGRGQGLVEFAIVVPVLMLVLLLGLDLGRVFFGWVGLTNASRIGASYAAGHPTAWGSPGSVSERASYDAQIMADLDSLNCALPGAVPAPVLSGTNLGDSATVTLSCEFSLITPLVSQLLGGTITIGAESVFPVRAGMTAGGPMGSVPPSAGPSASPDPSATPAPTPRMCMVPSMIGDRANTAQAKWSSYGFSTPVIIYRPPSGNYVITGQFPAYGGAQQVNCDTTVMTVTGL